jgi:hypothetical protein
MLIRYRPIDYSYQKCISSKQVVHVQVIDRILEIESTATIHSKCVYLDDVSAIYPSALRSVGEALCVCFVFCSFSVISNFCTLFIIFIKSNFTFLNADALIFLEKAETDSLFAKRLFDPFLFFGGTEKRHTFTGKSLQISNCSFDLFDKPTSFCSIVRHSSDSENSNVRVYRNVSRYQTRYRTDNVKASRTMLCSEE